MNLVIVGTNHKYSPIELRERISFSQKRLKDALSFLKERRLLDSAVILSTCNRVEIYASAEDAESGIGEIKDFISRYHEIGKQRFLPYLYIYEGKQALRHLILVACGLDSLILGETQVKEQVKYAFQEAEAVGVADGFLKEVFNAALTYAETIRKVTGISQGEVSVGSAAIDFIKEKIGSLKDKNILIIGVGKVTELVLQYLKKENPRVVFVANRTFEKARAKAEAIGAEAVRFDVLKQSLRETDILITAAASPHFIIKKETLEDALSRRILIVDLALPRNVEPAVKELKEVELFGLEDLGQVIQKNLERRKIEAEKANGIIDIEVQKLWQRLIRLEPEPARLP